MEEEKIYYSDLFKKIANSQKSMLNSSMSDQGLTYVQSLIILYLLSMKKHSGAGREVSQKDVERYLSLKGSTVTIILNRMEENAYIIREKSSGDSRKNHLTATEKGVAAIPNFFQVLNDLEVTMTIGMDETEKVQLKNLLQKVLANLEKTK